MRIDHLGIAVKDLSEAVQAYEALGFAVEARHAEARDPRPEERERVRMPVDQRHDRHVVREQPSERGRVRTRSENAFN